MLVSHEIYPTNDHLFGELLEQGLLVIVSTVLTFSKRGKYRVGWVSVRTLNIGPKLAVKGSLFRWDVIHNPKLRVRSQAHVLLAEGQHPAVGRLEYEFAGIGNRELMENAAYQIGV